MKVFLTGGTGFIGQPLTKSLLRRGWSVTALVRKPDSLQAQSLSKIGTHLVKGDCPPIVDSKWILHPQSTRDKLVC